MLYPLSYEGIGVDLQFRALRRADRERLTAKVTAKALVAARCWLRWVDAGGRRRPPGGRCGVGQSVAQPRVASL